MIEAETQDRAMTALLTWPAHGTFFATARRGWIDRGRPARRGPLPEPSRRDPDRLTWPAVTLQGGQARVIVRDLHRIAALRGFALDRIVAAADHVHVLLTCDADRDVPRLVQSIKGALSRALSAAAGDPPATSTAGATLAHRKWWSRQYSWRVVPDDDVLAWVRGALDAHADALVWPADRAGRGV